MDRRRKICAHYQSPCRRVGDINSNFWRNSSRPLASIRRFRPFATCGIGSIRSASFRSIPAARATDIRFAVSTLCHSASCGYLSAVFLFDRFAPGAGSLWSDSTRLLLVHIVLPCLYYTILSVFVQFIFFKQGLAQCLLDFSHLVEKRSHVRNTHCIGNSYLVS